jgi:hypothetical protein
MPEAFAPWHYLIILNALPNLMWNSQVTEPNARQKECARSSGVPAITHSNKPPKALSWPKVDKQLGRLASIGEEGPRGRAPSFPSHVHARQGLYVHAHTYARTLTHTYTYTHAHKHARTCMHTYVCTRACIRMQVQLIRPEGPRIGSQFVY